MFTWQEFYQEIKDPSWPDCKKEEEFDSLPDHIKQECINVFDYKPGQFLNKTKLPHRVFPIKTATACQLKWTWSTVYLTTENTASCHRTDHHKFDTEQFDFHNTPKKLNDRQRMLEGLWPTSGCNYCQDIEAAGGQSDRITNLDFSGIHTPLELDHDRQAIRVSPRILEVYFDNTCNLKCLYCGPHFSSLWAAENQQFGSFKNNGQDMLLPFVKSKNIESNKQKLFAWLKQHAHTLTVFNILGGEPLYQKELDECLELFKSYPAPELKLQIFTNLNAKLDHVKNTVNKVQKLIDQNKLKEFEVTASLDCWGPAQEYVRYPLKLSVWESNFEYLVSQPWINLIINSTVTPMTVKTLPKLLTKINQWGHGRDIYHYQNSVNSPSYMFIDIFGDIFKQDFEKALALKPSQFAEQISSKNYLAGIAKQSQHKGPNILEIQKLHSFLNEMDRRRNTNWRATFPWLIDEFGKYQLT